MSRRSEFDGILRELAQQQSALSQQQAALLQLQSESLRLQRLLIERAMAEAQPELQPIVVTPSTDQDAQKPAAESPHVGQEIPIAAIPDRPKVSPESPSEDQPPPDDSPF